MEKKENIIFLILVILAAMGMAFVFSCKVIPTQTPDTEPIGPYHHRDPATWAKKNAIKNQPVYKYGTASIELAGNDVVTIVQAGSVADYKTPKYIDGSRLPDKQKNCKHEFNCNDLYCAALHYCKYCGICSFPPICDRHAFDEITNECIYCGHKK